MARGSVYLLLKTVVYTEQSDYLIYDGWQLSYLVNLNILTCVLVCVTLCVLFK